MGNENVKMAQIFYTIVQAVQTVSMFELMFRRWKMMKNVIYVEGSLLALFCSLFRYLPFQFFSFSFVAAHAILTWFIDPARVSDVFSLSLTVIW